MVDFVMDGQNDVLLKESCCEWCAAAPASWAVFVGAAMRYSRKMQDVSGSSSRGQEVDHSRTQARRGTGETGLTAYGKNFVEDFDGPGEPWKEEQICNQQ